MNNIEGNNSPASGQGSREGGGDRKRSNNRLSSRREVVQRIWQTLTFATVLRSLSIRQSLPRGAAVRPSQNLNTRRPAHQPHPNPNIITYATNGPPRLRRGGAFRRPNSATGSYSGSGSSSSSGLGGSRSGIGSADSKLFQRPASAMSKLSTPATATGTGNANSGGSKRRGGGGCLSRNGSSSSSKGSNKRRRSLGSGEVYGRRQSSNSARKDSTPTGNAVPVARATIPESSSQQSLRAAAESALRRTDTYRHLVDINLHRWIVWLFNRCLLLPHIYVPSLEHFTFGSIHDVSYRLQQVEDASIGAGRFLLIFSRLYKCTEQKYLIISNELIL